MSLLAKGLAGSRLVNPIFNVAVRVDRSDRSTHHNTTHCGNTYNINTQPQLKYDRSKTKKLQKRYAKQREANIRLQKDAIIAAQQREIDARNENARKMQTVALAIVGGSVISYIGIAAILQSLFWSIAVLMGVKMFVPDAWKALEDMVASFDLSTSTEQKQFSAPSTKKADVEILDCSDSGSEESDCGSSPESEPRVDFPDSD